MRTTLDIAEDVLVAAKERAKAQGRTAGEVLSELARQGLAASGDPATAPGFLGFRPLPKRGALVTNELIDTIKEEIGE
ncbi:hypothetical protein ATK17_0127 [Branchiibius hedensis]|uniref:Antitoxin n=1 Tax=Branchiibius hedensis TaxID=672460 RepID=A0A2Y9BST2_9MICO|nr:antitoxin [Branchiibius hedensis]PWJ24044.1 hypothetical protein ATK17_0127 [Branchiibius hedensis]SSA32862.1 hypothetical protein SAMN04489750_0127 [Branchiibius hedensis]